MAYRSVNWGKTDVITPDGDLWFSRRFVMAGRSARIISKGNVTDAQVEFEDFWYHEGSTYRGRTVTGDVWEILKLRCNCRS